MIDRDTILEFRHFFESPQWALFEDKILKEFIDKATETLLSCPIEQVDNVRGQIKALQIISSLKTATRKAYAEAKNDRL